MTEEIKLIPIDLLHSFQNHPFQVKEDEDMEALKDSIAAYGVLSPLLVRPRQDGYEIISGHRRRTAAVALHMDKLPVVVRDLTDDEAIILMVDSNIQRETLLPSEKAFAYLMKLKAIERQDGRPKAGQVVSEYFGKRSTEIVGETAGESYKTVQRYIRLTHLVKPILDMVDEQRIAFSPAVELSFLTKQEQAELWDIMQTENRTPSLSRAARMKKLSRNAELTPETIASIMSETKPNQKDHIRFEVSALHKFFPESYTPQQIEQSILALGSLLLGVLGALVLVLDNTVNGLFILAAAFLISPYGLPMLAARLLGGIEVLRYAIQERL